VSQNAVLSTTSLWPFLSHCFRNLPILNRYTTTIMVNFHLSAQNISLEDGHILHAELSNEDGDYVESTLDLDYYIGNHDGAFAWGGEGNVSCP
jgi:hypothetical protein